MQIKEDEPGNGAKDLRNAGTTLGESFLFCLTASALNRKSLSGDDLGSASCGEEVKWAGMQRATQLPVGLFGASYDAVLLRPLKSEATAARVSRRVVP